MVTPFCFSVSCCLCYCITRSSVGRTRCQILPGRCTFSIGRQRRWIGCPGRLLPVLVGINLIRAVWGVYVQCCIWGAGQAIAAT